MTPPWLPTSSIRFNPRVPCGTRLNDTSRDNRYKWFQSARPVWDATSKVRGCVGVIGTFQSARPVWDATIRVMAKDLFGVIVSIRASRVGRDGERGEQDAGRQGFNPRVPCGRDHGVVGDQPRSGVSIRASRVGRDPDHNPIRATGKRFNPRVPCGTRPSGGLMQRWKSCCFNPRVPCGTRQHRRPDRQLRQAVSIRASRVGRDSNPAWFSRAPRCFNPRVPCGTRLS